jgi:hypothetical protein
VVPKCRNVDRHRRAPKGRPTGGDARCACEGWRGLKALNVRGSLGDH